MIRIDVVSDVACPWCFLGKRRLDRALLAVPEIKVEVVFRPFFLDPTIPAKGVDRLQYMTKKFGTEKLKTLHDPLIAAGKEDGVPYHFDKITRSPNSMNAHRLLRWSHQAGCQSGVAEALFMAYWSWGQDISDIEVLITIAIVNGFNGPDVAKHLASDLDKEEVLAEAKSASEIGVTGVPTMIVNKKYGMVGAQSVTSIVGMLQKVNGAA